jgi:hypothetical protein
MSDKIKIATNKSFGYVFFIFFLILDIYIYFNYNNLNKIILFLALLFFVLGYLNSKVLTPLNYLWFQFGLFLSRITTPIIMTFFYILIVTPIGLLARFFGNDFIRIRNSSFQKDTYWLDKKIEDKTRFTDQF